MVDSLLAPIRVGIIGASVTGWARTAHIPALRTIPGFRIQAVSTTKVETARQTAEEFGIPEAYGDADSLIASDTVDVVIVAVRVPHHFELMKKIIAAGKPVYCEWPAGSNLEQTRQLAQLAREAGVHVAVGLQARSTAPVRYVRDLVADGYVGRVLSTSLLGAAAPWGAEVQPGNEYLEDHELGGTMLTIPFGHAIDGLCFALGEFVKVSGTHAIQRPDVRVTGTDRVVTKTTPDQLLVTGELESGALISAHYRGGQPLGTNFHWEINGTEGDIVITAPAGSLQISELSIFGGKMGDAALQPLDTPASYVNAHPSLPRHASNVAEALICLERDLREGTRSLPGFDEAILRKEMLDAVLRAGETGCEQEPSRAQAVRA